MQGIRLYLVNRQSIVREGLVRLFGEQPRVSVVGHCGNGLTCLRELDSHRSDIVMTDLDLPDMDGYTLCRRVIALRPATRVMILTEREEPECMARALQAGASGYLLTDEATERAMQIIDRVLRGRFDASAVLGAGLIDCLENNEPAKRLERLTKREFELLCLLAETIA